MPKSRSRHGAKPEVSPGRATLAAACASLVGIGLARFAYAPLLPAIIGAHWFAPSAAAYLGAANLVGYLAGALLTRPMASRLPAPALLRGFMLLASIAFFACSVPVSLVWFFVWRLLSGIAGGGLMVLAAPTVLPWIPQSRRGVASGVIFAGIGIGIAASGTIVPLLLQQNLALAWDGLGLLALVLTAVAWRGWPARSAPAPTLAARAKIPAHSPLPTTRLRALYVQYALNAAGLVPHMLFLVDYVARGLGQGLDSGAQYWVLFGLGAIIGPVLTGHLADRTGFGPALRLAFFIQAGAVILPALGTGTAGLILSSLVMGAFTPGIVPLVLGRVHELLAHHPSAQKQAWSTATTAFALLQAGGAYGLTYLLTATGGDYRLLFVIGACAFALGLGIDLVVGVSLSRRRFA
ncbi:YbfB/YjiJ family MFS transporter [Acidisoma cellulosilytica]|uniref:YbfB/YjiJ family MFS transporter n=1 Tax=Acidisoma cellulosilyticum TaxID=2802395 RepID=A0A963Z3M9_9PROT|nr:YbfB/YjiJ family MFS transporter [Acidisoma cellulosilyticum]MCB8882172.1 YbfB/YjiJ family MFS transporter [Acidisoma cellulosilyticum]